MDSLGSALFSEISPKFFEILVSVNARVYPDVIDALEREMPAPRPAWPLSLNWLR